MSAAETTGPRIATGLGLAAVLMLFAFARPIDHDESQYVAAAVLAAQGWPYRDFAYLQTPLQPLLTAPVAVLAGIYAWPALRLLNALLGAGLVVASHAAMRAAGVRPRVALICAALLAASDILLFSATVARNDALPGALLALALLAAVRIARGERSRWLSVVAGVALAGAAAAKISYALPAAAYGCYALVDRRHRPVTLALAALPVCALVAFSWWQARAGFVFGVFTFPAMAPAEYYTAIGRPEKLSPGVKALDLAKFMALGVALPAAALIARNRPRGPVARLCVVFLAAGVLAAVLPSPTWRQYLLPALPPLFVLLALAWDRAAIGRGWRIALATFAVAGVVPTLASFTQGKPAMPTALAEARALRAGLDRAGIGDGVATLSPQFLPGTGRLPDPRWAAGPFYFRGQGLLSPGEEAQLRLVSRGSLDAALRRAPPSAILVGGEGEWTAGSAALDAALEGWARQAGWQPVAVASRRFRLYAPPAAIPATAPAALRAISSR